MTPRNLGREVLGGPRQVQSDPICVQLLVGKAARRRCGIVFVFVFVRVLVRVDGVASVVGVERRAWDVGRVAVRGRAGLTGRRGYAVQRSVGGGDRPDLLGAMCGRPGCFSFADCASSSRSLSCLLLSENEEKR